MITSVEILKHSININIKSNKNNCNDEFHFHKNIPKKCQQLTKNIPKKYRKELFSFHHYTNLHSTKIKTLNHLHKSL